MARAKVVRARKEVVKTNAKFPTGVVNLMEEVKTSLQHADGIENAPDATAFVTYQVAHVPPAPRPTHA